jgi:hypothetical protein
LTSARRRLKIALSMPRRRAFWIVIAIVAGAVAFTASSGAAGAARPAGAATISADPLSPVVCNLLEDPAGDAAKSLWKRFRSLKRLRAAPSLAIDLIVKIGFTKCETGVSKLLDVSRNYLGLPSVPELPSLQSYQLLDSLNAETTARQLNLYRPASWLPLTSFGALQFVYRLCDDARRGRSPFFTLASTVPNATIPALTPLNAALSLSRRRCGLSAWQMSYLTSGVVSFVLGNVSRADFDPPFAFIRNPTFHGKNRYGNWVTLVSWSGFDRTSSIARYELWLRSNSRWDRIAVVAGPSRLIFIRPGFSVQFAIRAVDAAGNYGAYSYSASYRT